MNKPDVDKNTMPDGSTTPLTTDLPTTATMTTTTTTASSSSADILLKTVNGDQEFPVDLPESPEDKGIIRCICGIDEDDGFTIFCDRCSVWQHGACVGIHDESEAPDRYLCELCNPRPLDVQKAIRHQKQRQEAEQNNHKPRRRSSNHPRTKPNQQQQNSSALLAPVPSLPPPPNRREKHPSPPPRQTGGKRPRAGRNQTAPQLEPVPMQEEVDVVTEEDPDIPLFPIVRDYEYRDRNEMSPEVRQYLEQRLQHFEKLSIDDLPRDLERLDSIGDFEHKISIQPISSAPSISNLTQTFALHAAEPINENSLILEYTGQVGFLSDYKKDPINQYSSLQRPKQHVLFSPLRTVEVYIDARLSGNQARFVRRSCFPNARVALLCTSNATERGLHFGLFALKNIKPRQEITIAFYWNTSNKLEEMISSIHDESRPLTQIYPVETIRSMSSYASGVLGSNECACHDSNCVFVRLQKACCPPHPSRQNSGDAGEGDAMSIDGLPRSEELEASDMEEDSRPNSRGKQSSRDRTPSKDLLLEVSVAKTAREQRKIEHAMARFAQMEEKEKEKSSQRKKSEVTESEDSQQLGAGKRKRQGSVSAEARALTPRVPSGGKGRGVKRKSMSPSPGADRISESGASANESPKPSGRVPNRVKRTMRGRKEPSNKKVRVQPPQEEPEPILPKWVERRTISDSWEPPQVLWFRRYAEMAKREYEEHMAEPMDEIEVAKEDTAFQSSLSPKGPAGVPSTVEAAPAILPPARPAPVEVALSSKESAPATKAPLSLRVTLPPSLTSPSEHTTASTASSQPTPPSFHTSGSSVTSSVPPLSPLTTPSTPKVKISLADYRARRASGMFTTPTATAADPLSQSSSTTENFTAPPPPPLKSPAAIPKDLPPS